MKVPSFNEFLSESSHEKYKIVVLTRKPENDLGYVTSSCYSPSIKSFIALAFVKNGTERYGEKIEVSNPILKSKVLAEICNPIFVDPNGDRLRE